jgi:hypothetical protein
MKPSITTSPRKSLVLVSRDWVLIMPLIATCLAVAAFVLACWLCDGTIATLYEIDYFVPLPFYCVVISVWTFLPMTLLGLVITGATFMRRQVSK